MQAKTRLELSTKLAVVHSASHVPKWQKKEEEEEEEEEDTGLKRGGPGRTPEGALQSRCACNFEIRPRRCISPDEREKGQRYKGGRERERLTRGRRKASRG